MQSKFLFYTLYLALKKKTEKQLLTQYSDLVKPFCYTVADDGEGLELSFDIRMGQNTTTVPSVGYGIWGMVQQDLFIGSLVQHKTQRAGQPQVSIQEMQSYNNAPILKIIWWKYFKRIRYRQCLFLSCLHHPKVVPDLYQHQHPLIMQSKVFLNLCSRES